MKQISIIRYELKRLPKPYDTQCYEYWGNETQFDCLNKCYRNKYENRFKCIPKYNSLLTIQLNDGYIDPNVTFCSNYYTNQNNATNKKIYQICLNKCPVQCFEDLFIYIIRKSDFP